MLNRLFGDKIFCGLDIGARFLKASIIQAKDVGHIEILAVHEEPTDGFIDGAVSDLSAFSHAIQRVLEGVQHKASTKIKYIALGLGGNMVFSRRGQTSIPLFDRGNKVIGASDLKRIQAQARMIGAQLEEEVLHDFIRYYKVDGVNTALNPVGLYGHKLEANFLLVLARRSQILNLQKAVNQAGFDISYTFLSSYAASGCCLDEEARKKGCVFLDMGADDTGVLVFKDGMLKHVDTLDTGGAQVTSAIAEALNINFEMAENIKKSYASASDTEGSQEEVLVKKPEGYVPIARSEISHIVRQPVQALAKRIKHAVQVSQYYDQINAGVVVVGGSALMSGILECVEQELNMPIKMGTLAKELPNSFLYTAAVGLAQASYMKSVPYSIESNISNGWWKGLFGHMQNIYQEYF